METAAAKIGWAFFYTFGGISTFLSIPDKIFSLLGVPAGSTFHLSEPYQSVVSLLAILFLIIAIIRHFIKGLGELEAWKHKRMVNIHNKKRMDRLDAKENEHE